MKGTEIYNEVSVLRLPCRLNRKTIGGWSKTIPHKVKNNKNLTKHGPRDLSDVCLS